MSEPGAGSLVITPTDAEFTNSGDMRLILTGRAPQAFNNTPISVSPGVGSLTLTENSPQRGYGLQLVGRTPIGSLNEVVSPGAGAVQFTGRLYTLIFEPPDIVAPEEDILALTGRTPSIAITAPSTVGAIAFSSDQPESLVDKPIRFLSEADLDLLSDDITVVLSNENLAQIGALIENSQATEYDGKYNICDRTGFKAKPGQLIEDGYGSMVLPEFRDSRHPQEFVRSRGETHSGPRRPEPVGNELDVDDQYPSGVSADDL